MLVRHVETMRHKASYSLRQVESLQHKARAFRAALRDAGFTVGGDEQHPIVPVMLGDAKIATDFADALLKRGVYAVGSSSAVQAKRKPQQSMSTPRPQPD